MHILENFLMDAYRIIKTCVLRVAKFKTNENQGVKSQKNVFLNYKIKKSKCLKSAALRT